MIRQGRVTVTDVPAPMIEPGHVLVAVAYSLISAGTETSALQESGKTLLHQAAAQPAKLWKVMDYLRRHGVRRTVSLVQGRLAEIAPTGYSCAGIVEQVGSGVRDLQIGDQVACAGAGKANHAEWVVVPRNLVVPVPAGVCLRDAASTTLGAIALQGVRRADLRLGEWAAVIGLGLVGQVIAQLLRAAGVQVIGLDLDRRRVEKATALGTACGLVATDVDLPQEVFRLTEGHGVDATIIAAASQSDAIVQQAMEITRRKGRVVLVGAVGLGLKRTPLYEKEIDFLISCSYGPGRYDERYEQKGLDYPYAYVRWTENRNMAEYLRLLAMGRVDFGALVEEEHTLEEVEQAYNALQGQESRPIAVILRYPDASQERALPSGRLVRLRRSPPADGRIRVALVGAGSFAKEMHLPNLRRLSDLYQLRALVSRTGSNARDVGERFGADYVTTDYEEALADPEVDMVLIATRHHLHSAQAIQAAKSGKAVFLEKPMALNREELDRLAAVLEETGVPFTVGFNRRFSPAARRLKQIVAGRRNPLMVLYRVNADFLPPDHWVHTPEGGGRIVGEACHMLDLFNFLVEDEVQTVCAESLVPRAEHLSSCDNFSATLRYADGSVCTLMYTDLGDSSLSKEYIEVYVDGKVLVVDDFRVLRLYGVAGRGWQASVADKGHQRALRRFASSVRGGAVGPIPLHWLVSATQTSFVISDAAASVLSE